MKSQDLALNGKIQSRISQAVSVLGEVLSLFYEQEGRVRQARSAPRQDALRQALGLLRQIPTSVPLEDLDLGPSSVESLEESLQQLVEDTAKGLAQVQVQLGSRAEAAKDKIARLEALLTTLERSLLILRAPTNPPPGDSIENLRFDLGTRVNSLCDSIEKMIRVLEDFRGAENMRISRMRPRIQKVLVLLQRTGLLPRKGSRGKSFSSSPVESIIEKSRASWSRSN